MKRFLSIILAAILLFSALPLTAVAADTDDVQTPETNEARDIANDDADSGTVDEAPQAPSPKNDAELADTGAAEELAPISVGPDKYSGMTGSCNWELTPNDGLLHIYTSGNNGQIYDYTESNPAPWYNYRNYIKTLWIEKKVTYIGSYSFYGCTNLTTVSLPSTINHLGASAFNYCTSLQSISLASTSIEAIYSNTFYNCNSMPSCALPSTLKWIGSSAFEKCYSLESMTIPENVESIGSRAFMNCIVMNPVAMNSKLRAIGENAFAYCFALESIDIPSSIDSDIGEGAFKFCTSLDEANFEDSDETIEIGEQAFYGCSSLTEIEIPSCVDEICDYAFKNCTALEYVEFNEGLTDIDYEAFAGCSSLDTVDLPGSVERVGSSVFERCTSLEHVWLNDTISGIRYHTFEGCTSLSWIDLDWDNITWIDEGAFLNCTALEYVELPDGLEEVEEDAFTGCTSLKYLAFGTDIETLEPYCCGYTDTDHEKKVKDFALYGYAGTEPERYANEYGFTFIPYNLITSISVSDIAAPVGGEHPSYTATVPADKGYQIEDYDSSIFENGIGWYCVDDNEYVEKTDVFEAGKKYDLVIYLVPSAEKYRFQEFGFTATLNGITSGIDHRVSPKEIRLIYTFTAPAKVVSSVSVSNVKTPTAGAKPSTTAMLPLNSGYKLDPDYYASGIGWFDEDDFYVNPDNNERFVEGKTYTLRVQLVPTKGYEFTNSNLTATINGSSAGVTLVEPRKKILLSATYTCTGSGTITGAKLSGTVTSFIDNNGKVTIKLEKVTLGSTSTVVGETTVYGNSTYSFTGLNANGLYRLTVSKKNHVTRTYNVTAKIGGTTQDVKIHPLGDIDGDGKCNAKDYGMASAHAQKVSFLTGYQLACGDVVKNDGKITAPDAARIGSHAQKVDLMW